MRNGWDVYLRDNVPRIDALSVSEVTDGP
ncbi:hypothetical protein LCGC14_2877890, partial [marine sediment metagenome]